MKKLAVTLLISAILAAAYVAYIYVMRSTDNSDILSASKDAQTRIAMAGGVEKIRGEAKDVFRTFGRSKIGFMADELRGYPAIGILGQMDGIVPDSSAFPAHIKIRVGGRSNGYVIAICDPDSSEKPKAGQSFAEIESFIYVAQ
jgi:hypothetical protein